VKVDAAPPGAAGSTSRPRFAADRKDLLLSAHTLALRHSPLEKPIISSFEISADISTELRLTAGAALRRFKFCCIVSCVEMSRWDMSLIYEARHTVPSLQRPSYFFGKLNFSHGVL